MTVVVVTGNSQGVGLAISRELLSTHPDTQIIGLSRNHESTGLKELTEEFKGRIVSLPCDISDPVAVEVSHISLLFLLSRAQQKNSG